MTFLGKSIVLVSEKMREREKGSRSLQTENIFKYNSSFFLKRNAVKPKCVPNLRTHFFVDLWIGKAARSDLAAPGFGNASHPRSAASQLSACVLSARHACEVESTSVTGSPRSVATEQLCL